MGLLGRRAERDYLGALLADAHDGRSRAIVLRGEAGAGKTALLGWLVDGAEDRRIVTTTGAESEMELPYSGLHQLCGSMLDDLDRLPAPQRDALGTVFGLQSGDAPDRFLVGLATLTLLADVAEREPLLCVVDDAQWLDAASAQILLFVGRRLLAERIAFVCAARRGIGDHVFTGLPELSIGGLGDNDARSLLLSHVSAPMDAVVCQQIIMESHGNPLALIELGRTANVVEFAGGFGMPSSEGVTGRIEQSYAQRLDALPVDTRLLVLLAAAEPQGDRVVLNRAAETLGIDMSNLGPAVDAGLIELELRVAFAHPLVRSVAYYRADRDDRHLVHAALAEATDAHQDPDRRAWHRARATPVPDEEIALELEQSAARAQARGGAAATAAFLQSAFDLTAAPDKRAQRAVAAADACFKTGWFEAAELLLISAESQGLEGLLRAELSLLRGHLASVLDWGDSAAQLLLDAARSLEPFDLELARGAYLTAYASAFFAAHLGQEGVMLEICHAIEGLPDPEGAPDAKSLLLDGLARMHTHGLGVATPILQQATTALAQMPEDDLLRWGLMAPIASTSIWDPDAKTASHERSVSMCRRAGALAELPVHLTGYALDKGATGDLAGARLVVAEGDSVAAATGSPVPRLGALRLLALEGREAEASELIRVTIEQATARGQGLAVRQAYWAASILYNGLARFEDAVAAARLATEEDIHLYPQVWALPELVESASRVGDLDLAHRALERLVAMTESAHTDWALGAQARAQALLSAGETAEQHYRRAVDHFAKTSLRPDVARAHLLYGEWLRKCGRRMEAREQLRAAYSMFDDIGMDGFAGRAQHELAGAGEKVERRVPAVRDELSAQEEQIARLACDGSSNREIAAALYLSSRTVEWHLTKVFAKLGIRSRNQLATALIDTGVQESRPDRDQAHASA